jgi:hypothetical protein
MCICRLLLLVVVCGCWGCVCGCVAASIADEWCGMYDVFTDK